MLRFPVHHSEPSGSASPIAHIPPSLQSRLGFLFLSISHELWLDLFEPRATECGEAVRQAPPHSFFKSIYKYNPQ